MAQYVAAATAEHTGMAGRGLVGSSAPETLTDKASALLDSAMRLANLVEGLAQRIHAVDEPTRQTGTPVAKARPDHLVFILEETRNVLAVAIGDAENALARL